MNKEQAILYIKQFYPTTSTREVAAAVKLSVSQVRTLAKKHNITKCPEYKRRLKKQLVEHRKKWYEESIPDFEPSFYQEHLIYGSLLGDGYISKGAQRSLHYYYQEHFGENQRGYREWKLTQLKNLPFTIKGNYLRSASHPYFKQLHALLYPNNTKTVSKSFLAKCTHPVFLATLYLDDGSLVISYRYNANNNTIYCHPSIMLLMTLIKVQNLTGLLVPLLTDILSIGNQKKGKDVFLVVRHYQWRTEDVSSNPMIIIQHFTIEENLEKGVFYSEYRTSALPLLQRAIL